MPLLHGWIRRPHVAQWWGSEGPLTRLDETIKKYSPRIEIDPPVKPYIALLNAKPIGFTQSYRAIDCGDGWWQDETDPGVHGTDQFLADASHLGRGIGTRMVSAFVRYLLTDVAATKIQTDPDPSNARAIRCYEKVGFRRVGHIATPNGRALLMVLDRDGFS